ncbi:MAG: adenosine deaminase [Rhodospirillales bacterium]
MTDLSSFISGLPKAELHLHIEGALEPELMFTLADRNGVRLPYQSMETLRAAYRFQDLQGFLDLYYQGTDVLREERDFYDLARSYLDGARRQTIRYAEVFFDPQAHTRRGVPFATVIDGLHGAIVDAEAEGGVRARLILCFLRDLPEADAFATLEAAMPYRDRILGVGLDSAERGHPPERFARVFARAREAGLRTVAHAGEEGPAAFIAGALDELHAERIDHGVRCLEEPALVARLARQRIPLTVCPLSNVRLGVVPDLARHPLRELIECGLFVTVNSDDPAYFGGDLNRNYLAAAEALGLTRAHLCVLARNSFQASFLDDAVKAAYVAEVDTYCRSAAA